MRSKLAVSFGAKLDLDLVVGEQPPAATEVLVVSQDVNLIMGESEPVEESAESAEEILAHCAQAQPRRLGSVVLGRRRARPPLLLQAVVYDFARTPPTCEAHVFEALVGCFELVRARGLTTLAVQPLGTSHGGLDPGAFLRLLTQVCYSSAELGTSLKRVHLLLASPDELGRYEGLLQGIVKTRGRKPLQSE